MPGPSDYFITRLRDDTEKVAAWLSTVPTESALDAQRAIQTALSRHGQKRHILLGLFAATVGLKWDRVGRLKRVDDPFTRAVQEIVEREYAEKFNDPLLGFGLRLNHWACFVHGGSHTYQVAEPLARLLCAKEATVPAVRCGDLHLPFRAIRVLVPREAGLLVYSEAQEGFPVHTIYVAEERDPHEWLFMVEGGGGLLTFHLSFNDTLSVKEQLERFRREWKRKRNAPQPHTVPPAVTFLANVVLYATHAGTEPHEGNEQVRRLIQRARQLPKGSRKRRNLNRKVAGMAREPRFLVGRDITIDRTVPRGPTVYQAVGTRLDKRVRVAGHLRFQACGPGWLERKLIWIEPFWRGPVTAPQVVGQTRVLKANGL